ncbi:Protein CL16A [Tieghemiomyces parasiticus]|uniref:Protein CL16A n=1 Tax=Tieghemiomyces parasiticus TaxID=78921 RepID=A0A9W8AC43_9FUNG|nr:Protein CL16A [Tieghemiomyces parasiticus]
MLPRWLTNLGSEAEQSPEQRYMHKIEALDRRLASFSPHSDTHVVIEKIRQLSEVLIYCDRHHPELLGYFLEKQMHLRFFGLLDQKMPVEVLLQFLQTLSIIIDSIKTENFMYYLLSNNYINRILQFPFDFSSDEVLAYYVSFLKTLSLKLTPDTVHFFCNAKTRDFPLYTSAIRFFDHKDTMVRIAVKSITLNVYRTLTPTARAVVLDHPSCRAYFYDLVRSVRRKHEAVVDLVRPGSVRPAVPYSQINQILEEHLETIAYVNDVFGLGVGAINSVLAQTLRTELLYPVYLAHLLEHQAQPADPDRRCQAHVSLVFLTHLVMTLKYPSVINEVATMLFSETARDLVPVGHVAGEEMTDASADGDGEDDGIHAVDGALFLRPNRADDTLAMPLLCLCYFLLINKAVSPSTLAQTSLCPRRLARTKDILQSLMGSADAAPSSLSNFGTGRPTDRPTEETAATAVRAAEANLCPFAHQHPFVALLLDWFTTNHACRPVTVDLAAAVLDELTLTADPVHVLCTEHRATLQTALTAIQTALRDRVAADVTESNLSAVVAELHGLQLHTFEQRMFNAILEAKLAFPTPSRVPGSPLLSDGASSSQAGETMSVETTEGDDGIHLDLARGAPPVVTTADGTATVEPSPLVTPFRPTPVVSGRTVVHFAFHIDRWLRSDTKPNQQGTPTHSTTPHTPSPAASEKSPSGPGRPPTSLPSSASPLPVAGFEPVYRERQVLPLAKHPHIPVVVHARRSIQVFHGFLLSDEQAELVILKPQRDHPGYAEVVYAVPVADLSVHRVVPASPATGGGGGSGGGTRTSTSQAMDSLLALNGGGHHSGGAMATGPASRARQFGHTLFRSATSSSSSSVVSLAHQPSVLDAGLQTSSGMGGSDPHPQLPRRQLHVAGPYYRPQRGQAGHPRSQYLDVTLHFKDKAAALFVESRLIQARTAARQAIAADVLAALHVPPTPSPLSSPSLLPPPSPTLLVGSPDERESPISAMDG